MENKNHGISRGRPARGAAQVEAKDRESQTVALRAQGLSWTEIAHQIGYSSASGAYNAYQSAQSRVIRSDLEEMRALENDRLDALHRTFWDKALEGDLKALDAILKISDRRCRLNGLYAPIKVKAETNYFPDPLEIDAELSHLLKLMADNPRPIEA